MGLFGRQLYFLLYKNYLFKARNRRQTFAEVIIVLYFVGILAVIKVTSPTKSYPVIPESKQQLYNVTFKPQSTVGYVATQDGAASSPFLDTLVREIENKTKMFMYKFNTESAMDDFYHNNVKNFTLGLVMNYDSKKQSLEYTIKTPKKKLTSLSEAEEADGDKCRGTGLDGYSCPAGTYISTGFASLQSVVDLLFMQVATNQNTSFEINSGAKMFPKSAYSRNQANLRNVIGIYMVIAFAPYILFLLTYIVAEKEQKIKESMKIMGLNMIAFWLSWFITYAVVIFIGCILTTAIAVGIKLFEDTNFLIVFLILFLYGLSIITLSFMFTPLFTKAKSAGMAGSMATLLFGVLSLIHIYAKTSNAVKWLTSLLSPVAMSLGLTECLNSITWSNISSKGEFPVANSMIMLFIDTIIYLLLAIYLDAIFPGEYGKARHPLFLFFPSFWRHSINSKRKPDLDRQRSFMRSPSVKESESNTENIEDIPEELLGRKVISVYNLKKVFKQGRKKPDVNALNGVSFDVFEGQITALLGHNGAGKSTLISTLTGMLTPSKGTAELYGFDIRSSDDMDNIRRIIGVCPQQNIIFEALNPREHLRIFAGLKGISSAEIEEVVNQLLKDVDLNVQANTIAKNLSGGEKRKLCVGIALIGNPKIVFLDEPTSGMDPMSRRHIWSLLQSRRENRVIFLTTHFMDEADILADYKAIMSKGKIQCAGSSLFLKNKFGIGYHLGMVVEENTPLEPIEVEVKRFVPGAEIARQHAKEIAFRLPMSEVNKFPDLFEAFERDGDKIFSVPKLGIVSYGVSMTTLEEVFLKLEELEAEADERNVDQIEEISHRNDDVENELQIHLTVNDGGSRDNLNTPTLELNPDEIKNNAYRGKVSLWTHFFALLEIRFWLTVRSPAKIIFNIIVIVIIVIGLVLLKNVTPSKSSKIESLHLTPSIYLKQGVSPSTKNTEVLWTSKEDSSSVISLMKDSFQDIQLSEKNVSKLNLLNVAPHAIAYNVLTINKEGQVGYVVLFNDSKVHSLPVGINTMSNAMYHQVSKKAGHSLTDVLPISTRSKPFKPRSPLWEYDALSQTAVMLMGLGLSMMAAGFSVELVMFRQLGIRHQLRVSGTSRAMYWAQFLFGDAVMYIFPVAVLFICIAAMDIKAFNMAAAMGATFLLLLLYIPSSILFTYTVSFLFSKFESAQNALPTIINIVSLIPYYAVSTVDLASGSLTDSLHATLAVILAVLDPPFTMLCGLYYIARAYRVESIIQQKETVSVPASKYFEWYKGNALPAVYLILAFHICILIWTTFAIDCYKAGGRLIFPLSFFKMCKNILYKSRLAVKQSIRRMETDINDNVRKEKENVLKCVLEGKTDEKSIVVEGLCKQFKKKKVVNNLNLMVNRGEIFGILGPNGAGKTTALNMITADLDADKGQIFVDGYNIGSETDKAYGSLGYCPQFDALWEDITVKEHLKCYGLIKGVSSNAIDTVIRHYAQALKITEHLGKRAKELSGGTKRKLSFLISMIGDASIIIMDEPSCGMDPGARRFLWTAISHNISGSRGAIMTTHSMEEADALCNRVGIVVKGELKCVGTTQELKTTYGGGYQLEVKFKTLTNETHQERKVKIDEYVLGMFPQANELEYFGTRVTYKILTEEVKNLSAVFAHLEAGKCKISIEEYNFSQSSLEQVFLEMAKEQDDDFIGARNHVLEDDLNV